MIDDVAQGGPTGRIVHEQLVCVFEAVFNRTANHACSNDAYFHLARSSYRWGVGSNLPSFAICEAWRRESGVPQSTHVSSPTESTEARPALT